MEFPAQNNISESNHFIPSFEPVKDELVQVRELIKRQLTSSSSGKQKQSYVRKLLNTIQNRSGKMIRPALVLLTGKYFDCITDEHITVAACIEMVHNATLLHDDVIDEGTQRRGKPTINSLWGNESAVLLGDFLLSHVFKLCADLEPKVTAVIANAAVRLCEGELRQIEQKNNWQMSDSEYINVITEKSAALFSTSCYLGAILAKAGEETANLFSDFGLNAGIAFQITDDLLDIIGDEKRTGKTTGSDADKHKPTLAVIHLLNSVDKSKKEELIEAFPGSHNSPKTRKTFIELLKNAGSIDYAANQSQRYISKAIHSLDTIPQSQAKSTLIETANFMANRSC